ncbi:MAG: hypothetical protein ACI8T1_005293, partial [Verrucomicrobiales bacterium]
TDTRLERLTEPVFVARRVNFWFSKVALPQ